MATNKQPGKAELDRRKLLMLGLAGASALVLGRGGSVQAAEEKGVERKVFKDRESMIPGFPKVRLRAITYKPGANSKATMKNPMICECTRGTLEVRRTVRRGLQKQETSGRVKRAWSRRTLTKAKP